MDIQIIALTFAPLTAICALLYGAFLVKRVTSKDEGTPKMKEIALAISSGAMAYLAKQFKVVGLVLAVLTVLLGLTLGWGIAATFVLGGVFSGLTGYVAMWIAVKANVRTAQGATIGLNPALQVAFSAGTVNGMLIVGLGLLGVSLIYMASYFLKISEGPQAVTKLATTVLTGYGFGACLLALFRRYLPIRK